YLIVGEELNQIQFIPDQPDADILLKGFGNLRVALLGTSPEAHYVTEPVYRAEILPPDAKFPPNGLPVFRINYRNDDGGPGYGADSRLDFVAPRDGKYLLHIKDVRGLQGPNFAYQLIVRDATPDFTLTASPENPNVPRGGRLPVEVTANRMLGYQGPIQIKLLGLPGGPGGIAGITASPATIPAGQDSATVILSASRHAPSWLPAAPFKIEGRGWVAGHEFVRIADPEAPLRVTALMPPPDVFIAAQPREVALKPGQTATVTIHIARQNGFKGRVPCQVENLPPGVRVVNVGLNGVLVHSGESSHTFTLTAESWAQPATQPIYVVGTVESNSSTDHASPPILLKVEGKSEMAASATAH
ncbi:MAG: c-type cytochrome domain-containing protein, partial [Terriglobia bacterium]